MIIIKELRLWQWLTTLLIICNICLILFLILNNFNRPPVGPQDSPKNIIINQLGFSESQVAQYNLLIDEHRKSMNNLKKESIEHRKQLYSTLTQQHTSNLNIDSLMGLVANNQKQVELITYQHFEKVRNLCNANQKQEFNKIILEVIQKMNEPSNGRPASHQDNNNTIPPLPIDAAHPPPFMNGNRPPPLSTDP